MVVKGQNIFILYLSLLWLNVLTSIAPHHFGCRILPHETENNAESTAERIQALISMCSAEGKVALLNITSYFVPVSNIPPKVFLIRRLAGAKTSPYGMYHWMSGNTCKF